ncbi:MAG: DUF4399 domain-containing protein [Actinomycetota bacterium]
MEAEGLTIEPSGDVRDGAGHFHVTVDASCVAPGEQIPKDGSHLRFEDGASEAELDLPAGEHTLCLQAGDGAHTALDLTDEITITVAGGAGTASGGYQFDGVGFDWKAAYVHDDLSGRVCGDPFKTPWIVSVTETNTVDPSNTGTWTVEVDLPGPNVETVGSRASDLPGYSEAQLASTVGLTFLPGQPPRLRVARLGHGLGPRRATVSLTPATGCEK